MDGSRIPVHIECVVHTDILIATAKHLVLCMLNTAVCCFEDGPISIADFPELKEHFTSVAVCDLGAGVSVSYWQAQPTPHVYRLVDGEGQKDYLDGADDLPACEQWVLPCRALASSLWDSVVVPGAVKRELLGYGAASSLFADRGVDAEVISWSRMVLLHGPPGTGCGIADVASF